MSSDHNKSCSSNPLEETVSNDDHNKFHVQKKEQKEGGGETSHKGMILYALHAK